MINIVTRESILSLITRVVCQLYKNQNLGTLSSMDKRVHGWNNKSLPLLTLNTMAVWSSSKSDHMPTMKTSGFQFGHWAHRSDTVGCCPPTHTQLPLPSTSAVDGLSHSDHREGGCAHLSSRRSHLASGVMLSTTAGNWWWMTAFTWKKCQSHIDNRRTEYSRFWVYRRQQDFYS